MNSEKANCNTRVASYSYTLVLRDEIAPIPPFPYRDTLVLNAYQFVDEDAG